MLKFSWEENQRKRFARNEEEFWGGDSLKQTWRLVSRKVNTLIKLLIDSICKMINLYVLHNNSFRAFIYFISIVR